MKKKERSETPTEAPEAAVVEEAKPPFDWAAFVRTPEFIAGAIATLGILAFFWPLLQTLPSLWMSDDGYYSHGFLVPLIAGYVINQKWPAIKAVGIKPGWWALPFLIVSLALTTVAIRTDIRFIFSVLLVFTLLSGTWFVLGPKILAKTWAPTAYLLFALPIWSMAIDRYTNGLQVWSTDVALFMLKVVDKLKFADLGVWHSVNDPTVIRLNNFVLDVGIPCSGFKLMLALFAFTVFFVMIGGLKWWANLIMLIPVPVALGLFINGLRISLIGIVGNAYGDAAGRAFHDYSGYITLLVCFFILFKIARWLGWNRDTIEPSD